MAILIATMQLIGVGVGWAILFGGDLGFVMAKLRPVGTIVEPYLKLLVGIAATWAPSAS